VNVYTVQLCIDYSLITNQTLHCFSPTVLSSNVSVVNVIHTEYLNKVFKMFTSCSNMHKTSVYRYLHDVSQLNASQIVCNVLRLKFLSG